MFYTRNAADAKATLSADVHLAFVRKCEVYIGKLKAREQLIAAQPIVREGFVLTKQGSDWNTIAID